MKKNKLKSISQPIEKKFKYAHFSGKAFLIFNYKYNLFNDIFTKQEIIDGLIHTKNQKNSLEKLKEYAETTYTNDIALHWLCSELVPFNDNLLLINFLLTTPGIRENTNIHADNDAAFKEACSNGKLDIVKYLLTSPELKEHADMHNNNDEAFLRAFSNNHLDVVQYLLTSPELKEHVDIHVHKDAVFKIACSNGNLDMVKYLLQLPELKEHAGILSNNNESFKNACSSGNLDLVSYFIFDLNIKKNKNIIEYLNQNSNEKIENMFVIRELNQQLEKDLIINKRNPKNPKRLKL